MLNQVTSFFTTDKAVANTEKRLSICLRSNGFSFSVTTLDDLLLTHGDATFDFDRSFSDLSVDIKSFFASIDMPLFGLKQARLVVSSDHFVWIPEHLYDSTRDRRYLSMVSSPQSSLGVYHLQVPLLKSYIVFSASSVIVTAFKLAIPGIDVHCQHSVLVNDMLLRLSTRHPLMLMHVRDSAADFDALYSGQLLLCNSCHFNTQNELLYHAIDVMKQLHLETPDMELAICGNVDRDIFGLLQHYFPNVTLFNSRPITFLNPDFQTLPTYKHVLLLN